MAERMDLTGPDFSKAQFWIEFDEAGERLVMPLRRSWKVVGWALLGLAFAVGQYFYQLSADPNRFEWFIGLLLFAGLLHVVLTVLTSLLAREIVRIESGDLIHGWRLFGVTREKRYPLREIIALSADREVSMPQTDQLLSPLKDFGKVGVVNFDYLGKTIGIGAAVDQAHGQQVVAWISRRAPRSVFEF